MRILLLLLLLTAGCKKECPDLPEMEGTWWLDSNGQTQFRFIFSEGTMYRDRFQEGVIDESLAVEYTQNGDTLQLSNYYNLISRKYLTEFVGDTAVNLTDISANAPYTVDFTLIKH